MHTRPVAVRDLAANFVDEYLLPRFSLWGPRPIAHFVSPQHDNLRIGPAPQDFRQGSHELVISAVWFEIAVDKRDYLVVAGESQAAIQLQYRLPVGNHQLRVDTVVNDSNLLPKGFGESVRLETGRADTRITDFEVKPIIHVFQPQTQQVAIGIITGFEFGVETNMRILALMIKFTIQTKFRIRPDILENRLSPQPGWARMTSGCSPLLRSSRAAR